MGYLGDQANLVICNRKREYLSRPRRPHCPTNSPTSAAMKYRYTCISPCEAGWNRAGSLTIHQKTCKHWRDHQKRMLKLRAEAAAATRPHKKQRCLPEQVCYLSCERLTHSELLIGRKWAGGGSCSNGSRAVLQRPRHAYPRRIFRGRRR